MQQRGFIIPFLVILVGVFATGATGYLVSQTVQIQKPETETVTSISEPKPAVALKDTDSVYEVTAIQNGLAERKNGLNTSVTVTIPEASDETTTSTTPSSDLKENTNSSANLNTNTETNTDTSPSNDEPETFQCKGNATGTMPNPTLYGDYQSNERYIAPQPGLHLYREVRDCATMELVSDPGVAIQDISIVKEDQSCYMNYTCTNRYVYQCVLDGTADTFYNESCFFEGSDPTPDDIVPTDEQLGDSDAYLESVAFTSEDTAFSTDKMTFRFHITDPLGVHSISVRSLGDDWDPYFDANGNRLPTLVDGTIYDGDWELTASLIYGDPLSVVDPEQGWYVVWRRLDENGEKSENFVHAGKNGALYRTYQEVQKDTIPFSAIETNNPDAASGIG